MNKHSKKIDSTTHNLIENERNYRHHLSRLVKISTEKKVPAKQKSLWEHDTLLKRGQDSLRRRQTQRLLDIQKDNDRILTNLLKITQRTDKKPPSQSLPKTAKPTPPVYDNGRIKSLNQTTRKNEILKILNENVKITGRLIFQESKMSRDKMAKDFQQHQQYSNRIRKVRVNSDRTLSLGHGGIKLSKDMRVTSHGAYLPPLQVGFLSQKDPGFSFRSSSAPKLQLSHVIQTERTQRSPTRDVDKKFKGSETHRGDTGSDIATQGTFISQLDLRSHSIPIYKAQDLQAQSSHIESTVTERNIQGYQSERIERNIERENEGEIYSQRTYITSFPVEETVKLEEDQKERDLVKEVSQTYEESQKEIPAETVEGNLEPRKELALNAKEKSIEISMKEYEKEEKEENALKDEKKENQAEEENREESVIDIPEDNDEREYEDDL